MRPWLRAAQRLRKHLFCHTVSGLMVCGGCRHSSAKPQARLCGQAETQGTQTSKPWEVEDKTAMREAVHTPTEAESKGTDCLREGAQAGQQAEILGVSYYECFKR